MMPLSSTVTAMKTKAAAILSRGLTAAFVFMLPRVLCLRNARWHRITPASTDNAVEAGNDTTHGGVVNAASSPFCEREGRRPPSPVEGEGGRRPSRCGRSQDQPPLPLRLLLPLRCSFWALHRAAFRRCSDVIAMVVVPLPTQGGRGDDDHDDESDGVINAIM